MEVEVLGWGVALFSLFSFSFIFQESGRYGNRAHKTGYAKVGMPMETRIRGVSENGVCVE